MAQDGVEVHKLTKKEGAQYLAILTEKAWSMKDLLFGFQGNFSHGTQWVVPSEQDGSILLLGQPTTVWDLVHLAHSQSWPYNKMA